MNRRELLKSTGLIVASTILPFQEIPLKIYRTPKVNEFVKGFKYEFKTESRMFWLDMADLDKSKKQIFDKSEWLETWTEHTWLWDSKEDGQLKSVDYRGEKWTYIKQYEFDIPYKPQDMINQGLIRVRVL